MYSFVLQAFTGNSNTESVVRHDLQNTIVARYLRIIPLDWSEEGRIGLRFEIYGCPYCKSTFFIESNNWLHHLFCEQNNLICFLEAIYMILAADGICILTTAQFNILCGLIFIIAGTFAKLSIKIDSFIFPEYLVIPRKAILSFLVSLG